MSLILICTSNSTVSGYRSPQKRLGRVLAECMFTAKIMYCMWITLADNDDNFVIETTKPLPKFKNWTEMQQKKFIKERILGKSNEELAQVTHISDCFTGGR